MTVMDSGTGTAIPDSYPTRVSTEYRRISRAHPTAWPGRAGPISDPDLDRYSRAGFLIMPRLLDATETARYWEELHRLCADRRIRSDERTVVEQQSNEVRSIFEVHKLSDLIAELSTDPRVIERARQVLGSDVYLHQSRINYMPGFEGTGFYWHSDFETWHAEDGMPLPRAVSISVALTENYPFNGGLMLVPGSQNTYVSCVGETPTENYKQSLRAQEIGTPDRDSLRALVVEHGIEQFTGPAGSAVMFDCNVMHGSGNNITPFPRSNIFLVYNSVHNTLREPYSDLAPRPAFIANRDFTPL